MSFFSRLFGSDRSSKVDVDPDSVWLTADAKFGGVLRQMQDLNSGETVAILLVAHFAETMKQLQETVERYDGNTPAMAVLAADLSAEIASGLAADETQVIDLIVAERHPLTNVDDQVMSEFADLLPCRSRVSYHISLDEPLMKRFAGDSVTSMLQALGMDENERIESSMVSSRIRAAQRKLTAQATGNRKAASMEEWIQMNLPQ